MCHFGYSEFVFLNSIFEGGSKSIWPEFWGGFAGAFFAFAFGLLTYWVTKRRERFVLHKTTLIKIDRGLMQNLYDLDILDELIKDTVDCLRRGHTTSNRLGLINIPNDLELDLASIDFINKIFIYRMSLNRLNSNINSTNHALSRIEDLFIGGQSVAQVNFTSLADKLEKFSKNDISKFKDWTRTLLILERIHQKRLQNKNETVEGVLHKQWDFEISDEEISAERKEWEKEVQEQEAKGMGGALG